jgi:hypothetical protein
MTKQTWSLQHDSNNILYQSAVSSWGFAFWGTLFSAEHYIPFVKNVAEHWIQNPRQLPL